MTDDSNHYFTFEIPAILLDSDAMTLAEARSNIIEFMQGPGWAFLRSAIVDGINRLDDGTLGDVCRTPSKELLMDGAVAQGQKDVLLAFLRLRPGDGLLEKIEQMIVEKTEPSSRKETEQ